MSIYGTLRTSISGMSVQTDRLSTIGDNIANVSTTGYKRAAAEFSTLVLQAVGTAYESGSVETSIRRSVAEQGALDYSKSLTDLAINGAGFFLVETSGSDVQMTRAGNFTPNASGELVNSGGGKLLGYSLESGLGAVVVNGTAGLEPVRLDERALKAIPSSEGAIVANLPASASAIAAGDRPSVNGAGAQYSARTSLVAYDSLGGEVTLDIYFAKTGPEAWEVTVFDRATAATSGSFPYAGPALATQSLAFDASNGRLVGSASSLAVPIPGGLTADIDLSLMSQFAGDFSIANARIDGAPAVPVSTYEMSDAGVLTAVYQNGARSPIYQIPLGYVMSPDNLSMVSGNAFLPTDASGDIQVGLADTAGLGSIVSGALEQSTVDIASEMAAMIEAQRNYTANSRVFQTGAELADVAISLRS
ncbi:MAG: flagellar hook protein FlgE [Hyphomicrobium sp.]|nr:flagellar hook protein FlgE [Hyphomicrobium sp.]